MIIRQYIPESIKKILRFFRYGNERRKVFREIKIRRQQNILIKKNYKQNEENLIVFIVAGADWFTGKDNISGGIMSIASIYEETKKLKETHNSEVIMVTHPKANLLLKHTQFENDIMIFRFEQVFSFFFSLKSVIFHVPTILLSSVLKGFMVYQSKLIKIENLHFNILNQNIKLMADKNNINKLRLFSKNITQTTAHIRYTTNNLRIKYGIPIHLFSVFADAKNYEFIRYSNKKNIILISPDAQPYKNIILEKIRNRLDTFECIIIKNLKYKEYKQLIKNAKFMITFGEGLDFYFIETVFSGGVSVAVYNNDFFTPKFKNKTGVFNSYSEMKDNIVNLIKQLDNEDKHAAINKEQFLLCNELYSYKKYQDNIRKFYLNDYTLP